MSSKLYVAAGMVVLGLLPSSAKAQSAPPWAVAPEPATKPATQPSSPPAIAPLGVFPEGDLTTLSLEDLMNVEVTSVSKRKQTIAHAPAAVTVIGQEEIRRSGYSTIPDLLRLAPGTHVGQINASTRAVGVRGFNHEYANKLLVLQDGRTIYTPLFGGVYWNNVDYILEDLERIEVIRGPGGTLWGANAVNGVINITSKDSADTLGTLVSTRVSNADSNVAVRHGLRLNDDTTMRVYAKGRYFDDFPTISDETVGDNWYNTRGGFRLDQHTDATHTFTLQGEVSDATSHTPVQTLAGMPPVLVPAIEDRRDQAGHILARWSENRPDGTGQSLQVYYDYFSSRQLGHYEQHTLDIDYNQRWRWGDRHEFVWGFGYRAVDSRITASDGFSGQPASQLDNLVTMFVQDTITLSPERWFLTLGTKLEFNEYTGFEMQPSARLLWTPNKQNSLWAAVSRSVRTPSIVTDRANVFAGTAVQSVGGTDTLVNLRLMSNRDQKAETLISYELGYRVEPARGVAIDATVFANQYDKLESLTTGAPVGADPVTVPLQWGNEVEGYTYGAEVASTVQVTDKWRLGSSYSLLLTHFDAKSPGIERSAADTGDAFPTHMAQVNSYYDLTRKLSWNVGVAYTGAVDLGEVPSHLAVNTNLMWRPDDATSLAVGVMNLLDDRHQEFELQGGYGSNLEVPRTFYVQFSYSW